MHIKYGFAAALVLVALHWLLVHGAVKIRLFSSALSQTSLEQQDLAMTSSEDVADKIGAPLPAAAARAPASDSPKTDDAHKGLLNAVCELRNLPVHLDERGSLYYGVKTAGKDFRPAQATDKLTVLIKSPSCPGDSYSYVSATLENGQWKIEKTLDCHLSSAAERHRTFRSFAPVVYAGKPPPGEKNLALGGSGDFLVLCPEGYVATREGHFRAGAEGYLEDAHGCTLLDSSFRPVGEDDDMQTLAVVDVMSDKITDSEMLDRGRMALDFDPANAPLLLDAEPVVEDYYERTDDPTLDENGLMRSIFQEVDLEREC